MQPKLCSRCHKNVAVVFITRLDKGDPVNEGLCLKCAKELGIQPVQEMMDRMGITEEDMENLTNEMMSAFGGPEGLEELMGGGMDLVAGAKTVIVAMEHCTKAGASKVLKHCTLPLTASRRVKYIVTELAVLKVTEHGLELMETAPGVTPGEVQEKTEATLLIPDTVGCME